MTISTKTTKQNETPQSKKQSEFKYAPYSASKLKTFDECPFKFNQHYILKIRPAYEPKPFFEKGSFIHWILEHYPNLPEKMFKFRLANKKMRADWMALAQEVVKQPRVKEILSEKVKAEMKFSLDKNFKPTKFKRKTSLLMGYIDNISKGELFRIIDWKTGQTRVSEDDIQLKLYALWFLIGATDVDVVECTYAFVEQENWITKTYTQADIPELKQLFINKIDLIENCVEFPKKPSRNCKWCDHFKDCRPFNFTVGEKNE